MRDLNRYEKKLWVNSVNGDFTVVGMMMEGGREFRLAANQPVAGPCVCLCCSHGSLSGPVLSGSSPKTTRAEQAIRSDSPTPRSQPV